MKKINKTKTNISNLFKLVALSALFISLFSMGASISKASDITPDNLGNLVNNERVERGLIPLKINDQLDNAASEKSRDMLNRNYFEHFAFGLTPWDFIVKAGYNYLYAGENLAMDFNTAEGTVNAWMDSPAHRKNILNPDFSDMGMGVIKGEYSDGTGVSKETIVVTNMFGREKPTVLRVIDTVIKQISDLRIVKIF